MEKTIKSIDHMIIHHPYACLEGESFITVRHVMNQKEVRLSRSEGNVNLTDFWFSILDNLATTNKSCSCQNIGLLADICPGEDESWWERQDGKVICIGFLKIASISQMSITEAMELLEKMLNGNGRLFRTLDNADIIMAVSMKPEQEGQLKDLIKEILHYQKDGKSIYFSYFLTYGVGKKEIRIYEEDGILRENVFLKIERIGNEGEIGKFCQKHTLYSEGWCHKLIGDMVANIRKYRMQKNKKMMSYYQALFQILNVLGQYEQDKIRKDLFYIFYPPISLFIEQLKESLEEVEKISESVLSLDTSYDDKRKMMHEKQVMYGNIEESISQFLETMELLMHHIGQSCEEIIGTTGHGGMPYDIPLRIILMYISFLNVLSDVLVEEDVIEEGKTEEEEQRKAFEYCLSPLAFAQAATVGFSIGDMEKSRLIRVKMPRHMLFMPRPFLVILGHEASHYAHESSRLRSERAKCIRKIVEYVLCKLLIDNTIMEVVDASTGEERKILENYLYALTDNLQEYLEASIYDMTEQEGGLNREKYYLDNFVAQMHEMCYQIFYDENHNLERRVNRIDDATVKAMRNIKKYPGLYEKIIGIQKNVINNAEYIAYAEHFHIFLDNLKRAFREIYADLSAIRLLSLSWDDYLEAYILSESCPVELEDIQPETLNRFAIVKCIMSKKTAGWKQDRKNDGNLNKTENGWQNIRKLQGLISEYAEIVEIAAQNYKKSGKSRNTAGKNVQEIDRWNPETENDWFYCAPILAWEVEFFSECDKNLRTYIGKKEARQDEKLKMLRDLYKSFAVRPKNEDGSFSEFFEAFDLLTKTYKGRVDEKYQQNKAKLS